MHQTGALALAATTMERPEGHLDFRSKGGAAGALGVAASVNGWYGSSLFAGSTAMTALLVRMAPRVRAKPLPLHPRVMQSLRGLAGDEVSKGEYSELLYQKWPPWASLALRVKRPTAVEKCC